MQIRNLGGSGLRVSAVGLGCNNFGQRTDLETSRKVIHRAIDLGVTLFDTADIYAGMGGSETVLGQVLGDRRKDIVVATKYSKPMSNDGTKQGASRRYIMSAVEASLTRLKTDYIDLYQQHDYDPLTPIDETLRALDDLIRQGKVRYIGASSGYAWQMARALSVSERRGWARFISMQNHYNLVYREEEREMIPLCLEEGVGVVPWSPLARGRLARTTPSPAEGTTRADSDTYAVDLYDSPSDLKVIEAVRRVATELGVAPSEVALAWLLKKPGVAAPIVGATKIEHLESAVRSLDVALSDEHIRAVEEPYQPHPVRGH